MTRWRRQHHHIGTIVAFSSCPQRILNLWWLEERLVRWPLSILMIGRGHSIVVQNRLEFGDSCCRLGNLLRFLRNLLGPASIPLLSDSFVIFRQSHASVIPDQ